MSEPKPAAETAAETAASSFGEAMEELERILQRIEGEEVDVDQLAAELRRASRLVELAREKIRRAEVEVTQIVQGIEAAGEGAASAASSSARRDPAPEPREEVGGDLDADDVDAEDQDDIPF